MAITYLQRPNYINATNTHLIYSLSSSNADQPQFRYVCEITGSAVGQPTRTTLLKFYPNTTGNVNVDISRIAQDWIGYDEYWKTVGSVVANKSLLFLDTYWGEEYGTSISSSRTYYPDQAPYFTSHELIPATVYDNQGSYNFNTSSLFDGDSNTFLTNNPSANDPGGPLPFHVASYNYSNILNSTDYHTLTTANNDSPGNTLSLAFTKIESGSGGTSTVDFVDISNASTSGSFNTFGVGPMNVRTLVGNITGKTIGELIDSGSINVYSTGPESPGGTTFVIKDKWDGIRRTNPGGYWSMYNMTWNCETTDYTRFAFINVYGFWDYYNVYNPLRRLTNVDRSLYDRTFVRYEDSQALYDISNRGNTQYKTEYTDSYEIVTDFIDKRMADWLTELFESPSVYIQKNGDFIPVNILNTQVNWNMNQYRQKLFQYTIQFKYANDRITR